MLISKIQTKTKHSPIYLQPCSNQKQFVYLQMLNSTPSVSALGASLSTFIYMAQSKSFFGLRRGSTKTLTFSVYNGKQVTKDRVAYVKNPRSSAQMKQRAVMATALRGYSALKEICDHSFEGITYGLKSMNYFVAENARMIRAAAPNINLSLSKGNSVSNPYIIAKGSLPPVILESVTADNKITFGSLVEKGNSAFSFGKLMAGYGATNIGDMVTFVHLVDNPGGDASIYWLRLKLTDEDKAIEITPSSEGVNVLSLLTEGRDFETNIDNFSVSDFPFIVKYITDDQVTYMFISEGTPASNLIPQSMGAIVSRKSDTGWLRSSSTMTSLLEEAWNYDEALASYPESSEKILNGGNV